MMGTGAYATDAVLLKTADGSNSCSALCIRWLDVQYLSEA